MTMYVTKVWGADDTAGPLVFGLEGWRDRASRMLKDGDLVILVGTMGTETDPDDRNRVLGMMEPTTIAANTSDFPLPWLYDPHALLANGQFRWPYALLNKQAWAFESGLFLAKVAPRARNDFGTVAAAGIVALTDKEAALVLAHPHHRIDLLQASNPDVVSPFHERPKGKGAPIPAEGVRRAMMHMRSAQADVYWFHLERGDRVIGHKIGWAFDWRNRLRLFNSTALPNLGGLRYQKHATYFCPSARHAFRVEQGIFRELDALRHPSNREVLHEITTEALQEVWAKHLNRMMLNSEASSTPS